MSTRSGRVRLNVVETSPPKTRKSVASPRRSPARTRKSSPKSRSATLKSPSRKSPSRKSPTRKSTSKNTSSKSPTRSVKASEPKLNSPSKRPAIKIDLDVQENLKNITSNLDSYRSRRSRRIEYTIQDLQSDISKNELIIDSKFNLGLEPFLTTFSGYDLKNRHPVEEFQSRRSNRLKELVENAPDIRRSISKSISESKSVSKSVSKSIEAISDEENSGDEFLIRKSVSVTRRLATPLRTSIGKFNQLKKFEFGGLFGPIILMTLIPITVFSILISCSEGCSYKEFFDLSKYMSLSLWFDNRIMLLVLTQYTIQAVFVIMPLFGIREQGIEKNKIVCFNGFFSCMFMFTFLFSLDYLNVINSDEILRSYLSLAVVSYIFAILLAILLYVKSYKLDTSVLNPYGNTGYFLNDFFVGREIHPSLKNLNIKLWISRIANINTLILSVLIFKHSFPLQTKDVLMLSLDNYKEFISKIYIKQTALLYSVMQIVYILNFVLKEHKITTTFFWQYEGLGYLQLISSALYPFYFTSITKYVVDVDLDMSTNALIAALTLFLVGFLIMLISNNIKHQFRKNPFHPSVTCLESMPTFHGNKLLVSNLWGILRHPNYAGDILIHVALALPGILTQNPVAALPAFLTILLLLHRAWRDHGRCSRRYGAAWQRYCKRVPSLIIPKIL